jgi:hypothetical protein
VAVVPWVGVRAYTVLLLALFLIPVAGATTVPNPCRLLTSAEVANQLGSSVLSRARLNGGYSCRWTVSDHGAKQTLELGIWAPTRAQFEAGAHVLGQPVRVVGIGQEAYASSTRPPFLLVWQRGIALRLDTSLPQNPAQVERALAKLATSRLPGGS